MYPSSSSSSSSFSSSSSHGSIPMGPTGGGLFRYGSAPGSLLTAAVDSVIGTNPEFSAPVGPPHYFSTETSSLTSESSDRKGSSGLQRSCGLNDIALLRVRESAAARGGNELERRVGVGVGVDGSGLVRHSSSPAVFLNRLATANAADNGFSVTRGIGSYNSHGGSDTVHGISRLNSQLSFTRQDSLSQITEESEDVHRKAAHSYATASFGMGSWDDTNAIMFSAPQSKRVKSISRDNVNDLSSIESTFGLPQTALEMATMEKLIEIPEDSVPCRIRAKRGCATHPRSIAERERRTRISGKLKKLQDLVPNMDKQTSYADMLDLAVQHIKGLQTQVQNLNKELENCTCELKQ